MKGKRIKGLLPVLLALLAGVVSPAFAQTDQARIVGTVSDSQGGVVRGADVTVVELRTSRNRVAATNDQGYYVITGLAPGRYRVTVKAADLETAEIAEVALGIGQERNIDVVLRPGTVTQSVTVSAGALAVMDTSSARIGVNVSEREVSQLPLNGRQVSQLYLLAPGAVNNGRGTYDDIRFSGRSNQQNIIRFDGIEGTSIIDQSPGNLNGEVTSPFRLQTSTENVQEFRVESSNYPAEYGTGTGGQISIVTKSGSNDLHGSVFEYLRNDALDARNFLDRGGKSPLKVNQFGVSVGGPILRDKLFFFGSYEGLRQHAGINLIELVPSPDARSRAVASIRPLLAAYPSSGSPTANPNFLSAQLNSSATVNEDSAGIRFDYKISPKYSLYTRYFRDQGKAVQPLGVTGNALNITAVPQNAVVSFQQILTPRIVNETKFGFNDVKTRGSGVAPAIPGVDIGTISVNIGGQVAISGIAGQTASAGVAIPGGLVRANSATNGRGQPYTNYSLSFIDNLSLIEGNHSMKFGVEVRPVRLWTDRLGGTTYTFSNLNDFLANRPSQIQFLGDVSAPSAFNGGATGKRLGKQTYYIAYAQDEWKLRPNLTMNVGLRYEHYGVMHEARNLDVVFDPVNGVIRPSDSPFYHSNQNFGPRLAFSWAPQSLKNNTIFRIGGGYYFGNGQTEDDIQPIESDRVSRTLPAGTPYPIVPADIIRTYNINDPKLGYQPRAYWPTYTIPEKILSYTASVQQKLPGDAILTVAYVGSQGRNLFLRSWSNRIIGVSTNPTTGKAIVTREFGDRFAEVDYKSSGGADHYNSMQTSLNRRFSKGLTLGLQWTWAHSIGNSGGANEARTSQNPYAIAGELGNNNFDVRHSLNISALYELPFGKGRQYLSDAGAVTNFVLGGWQLGGIFNARSGVPVEVLVTRPDVVFQVNNRGGSVGLTPGRFVNQEIVVRGVVMTDAVINTPGGGASRGIRRPDPVPGVSPFLNGRGDKTNFLDPAAFSLPAPGTYGNLGRNAFHGPSLAQLDFTLQKRFLLTERLNVEFRSEFYNILNKANFANPPVTLPNALPSAVLNSDGSVKINADGTVSLNGTFQPGQTFTRSTAAAFGVLSSTVTRDVGIGTNRQIQLSLRLNF